MTANRFMVVYEKESADQSFGAVRLRDLAQLEERLVSNDPKETMSFLMPEPKKNRRPPRFSGEAG
jgi:hypothetical protein